MKVMFTGHRSGVDMEGVSKAVSGVLDILVPEFDTALCGMALGSDHVFAVQALRHSMKLIAYVPFPEQPDQWGERDKVQYRDLLERADEVRTFHERYDPRAYRDRDFAMVDDADLMIAAFNGNMRTGTGMTVSYGYRRGIPRIIINDGVAHNVDNAVSELSSLF